MIKSNYINIIQKKQFGQGVQVKNEIVFGFGETDKTLPSADTL